MNLFVNLLQKLRAVAQVISECNMTRSVAEAKLGVWAPKSGWTE